MRKQRSRILSLQSYNEARSPDGGIGRRARLRTVYRKVCRFKSCSGHHLLPYVRGRTGTSLNRPATSPTAAA